MEELDNLTRHIQNSLIGNLFTFLPGIIEDTTDFEKDQTISVKPTIAKFYPDGVTLEPSVLYKVPLMLPSAGGALLSFPVAVGDTVALIFSCRDIDSWLGGDGSVTTPNSSRSHNISDAIAIPGLYPFGKSLGPSSTDVFLDFTDSRVTLKKAGGISISTSGDLDVDAVNVNLSATGSVNLGEGGAAIARVGDAVVVNVIGGSSAGSHVGTITSGGGNTST